MSGDIEQARVPGHGELRHPTLFPMAEFAGPADDPRTVCLRIGLNWLSALALWEAGLLSFDPAAAGLLSGSQKAELVFLGALAVAGCDIGAIGRLVSDLNKPYAYRLDRVYYDWSQRRWCLLGGAEGLEEGFEAWVQELVDWGDHEMLARLADILETARRFLGAPSRG